MSTSELMSAENTPSTLPEIWLACVEAVRATIAEWLNAGCSIQYSVELTAPTIASATRTPIGSKFMCSRSSRGARRSQVDETAPRRRDHDHAADEKRHHGGAGERHAQRQAHERDRAERGDGERREDLITQTVHGKHMY